MREAASIDTTQIQGSIDSLVAAASTSPDTVEAALAIADRARGVCRALMEAPALSGPGLDDEEPHALRSDTAVVAFLPDGLLNASYEGTDVSDVQIYGSVRSWTITYTEPVASSGRTHSTQSIVVAGAPGSERCWTFEDDGSGIDLLDSGQMLARLDRRRSERIERAMPVEPFRPPELTSETEIESEPRDEVEATSAPPEVEAGTSLGTGPVDKTEPATAPVAPQPAPEGPAESPDTDSRTVFQPTHRIADGGTTIGSVDSGRPPTPDLAGALVEVTGISDSGWAHVVCEDGAVCWVDPADLRSLHAEPYAPDPVRFWFYVLEPVDVMDSEGRPVGLLEPGTWYEGHREEQGWVATVDNHDVAGWVPGTRIHRQR